MTAPIPVPSPTDLEVRAREAQMLGKPQRIVALHEEEFDSAARALVEELHASLDIGDREPNSDYFRTILRHPALFRCQLALGIQLLSKGVLDPRHRELVILRVGRLCRAPFEWGEHVELAKRCGVTRADIEGVIQGSAAECWTEHERAIIRAVEELFCDQMIAEDTWNSLARYWTEQQLIELIAVVGQYVATAYLQNSLRISLVPGNEGLAQR